ncbi:MAG: M14 family metallopeptidase [Geitlerinemataceae cyanobacterium]
MTIAYADAFSPDYLTARYRFREAATTLGAKLEAHPIDLCAPNGEPLTIDAAILGSANPQHVTIVSSGLHGVEGFFGSALQLAWMKRELQMPTLPDHTTLVLLHALNPYGFAWRRRCNEDNADLNRNFLLPGEKFTGSPQRYAGFDRFFNPPSPPSQPEPFRLKAIALLLRYGLTALKETLPVGQYDFPKGLFFGGNSPSKTQNILAANLGRWKGNVDRVLHLDLHTGLGKRGTYKLLLGQSTPPERVQELTQKFGADVVEISQPGGTSYRTRGSLGAWCRSTFSPNRYDFVLAEFGTYPMLTVLEALRAENRAHWWTKPDSAVWERSKQRLVEAFAPTDVSWRETAIARGLELIDRVWSD